MRMPRSNRFLLNPSEKKSLARMARNSSRVNVVDKGDISDCDSSASLEEISADDFRHDVRGSRSRVWDDGMMGYSVASNFGPTLYSFAWAQAVQNKPLGLEINPLKDVEGETGKDGTLYSVIGDISEESIGEMEKEKGELEEGEIDLDSEPVLEEVISYVSDNAEDQSMLQESETKETDDMEEADMEDFDKRVAEILEELDTITPEEAEASLESVCSRLLKSFAGLKTMFTESYVPILDALVQQAFTGIQTLHSVFCSGNLMKTKQNMDLLLRLLIHIKNQYSAMLTLEQVTEIDSMAQLLVSNDVSKEIVAHEGNSIYNSDSTTGQPDRPTTSSKPFSERPNFNLKETDLSGRHGGGNCFANYELPIAKSRVEFSPLLDLHADYDEGSLPSPTRENGPPLLTHKPIDFSTSLSYPIDLKKEEGDEETLHSYMNDALKAVSSYQQKYQRTSINLSNQLPSPTPSEECSYENEKQDEVSSAFVFGADKSVKGVDSLTLMGFGNTFTPSDALTGPPFNSNKLGGQLNSMKNQIVKTKSRDPRLRFINDNVAAFSDSGVFGNGLTEGKKNCNKHRISDTAIQDDQDFKRQRHTSNVPTDMPVSVSNVVSETFNKPPLTVSVEIGMGKSVSAASTSDTRVDANDNSISAHLKNEKSTTISSAPSVTLPSLLKEMDISPAMLMELFKIKQQGLTEESQQKSGTSTSVTMEIKCASGYPGSASSVNGIKLKPEEVEQNPTSKPRISAQYPFSNLQNDMGRLRMKPRDPRRYFHDNTVTKAETSVSVSEQNKMDSVSNTFQTDMDRLIDKELGEQAQVPCSSSRQFLKTNIKNIADSMFTKNLKNIGDNNISATKLAAVSPILGPPDMLQPISSMTNKPVGRFTEFNESKVVNGISQTGTRDASQQANPWGDVDHLLNGYDDQQRAAIQKERARRIAEQNKMFAARKLCLVLDLDHTLLNSAKFGEVEQVHEEILRKKEEQDREQPQRHLFRFQHMAMWTKLRPGVWNFLEKASKIYELHLYTMGNKFYATEMAKVLDPTGILFAGRVISRGDDGDLLDGDDRVPKSKDLDGVLGMESAVVIIDDSVRVWPHNRHNLILVERYTYFPCSRRQFGLLGPSLLEIDHDERQEDGTLASCLAVIEKIHEIFFSHNCLNDVDVRHILATEQRKILAGCKIVFSRIFPVGEANPNFHPLWQTAEQFGAICTNQIDEQVTHVVANSLGTDKVNWALSTGRFVVHPGWVEASALLYRRANENDFAVKLYQVQNLGLWRDLQLPSDEGRALERSMQRESIEESRQCCVEK